MSVTCLRAFVPVFALIGLNLASSLRAQTCDSQWLFGPDRDFPGVNGTVDAMTRWDPDGAGPRPPVTVVGGQFTIAGNALATNIAIWDGVTWSALSTGISGGTSPRVRCLAVMSDGRLAAGGEFTTAGGVPALRIAAWDGTAWSPLGSGINGVVAGGTNPAVRTLVVLPTGELVAGGFFNSAGGVAVANVAKWDGVAWSAMGGGLGGASNASIFDMDLTSSGQLVATGTFTTSGGSPIAKVARWEGTSWSSVGSAAFSGQCIATRSDGSIFVGSQFAVNRWSGTTWTSIGSTDLWVDQLLVLASGDLVAGGRFLSIGGSPASRMARWNGLSWAPMGSGITSPSSAQITALLELPDGRIVAGGTFIRAGLAEMANLAAWDGASWAPLTSGFAQASLISGGIQCITPTPDGGCIVGGYFASMANVPGTSRIARWDGREWHALGSGIANDRVEAIVVLPNGDVIVGGQFISAGGVPGTSNLARWTGTAWESIGGGTNSLVSAITVADNGDIIVGGSFSTAGGVAASRLARWNGSVWTAMGNPTGGANVNALLTRPNGDIIAVYNLVSQRGFVIRWNGVSWSTLLSTSISLPHSITQARGLANGDILITGTFTIVDGSQTLVRAARWDGSVWNALGTPSGSQLLDIVQLQDGSIAVAGNLPGGVARWDGVTWSPLTTTSGITDGVRSDLAILSSGELIVGGSFSTVAGQISHQWARWSQSGQPWVALQPSPVVVDAGQTVVLSAAPASGYPGVSVAWTRDAQPIVDGPEGSSAGGGEVLGAMASLQSPTDGTAVTLQITNAQVSDSGDYRATFLNSCGDAVTVVASVTVLPVTIPCPACAADYDQNGGADGGDLAAFFSDFEDGLECADVDQNGGVDGGDLAFFFQIFEAGGC